jgi:DNA-binding response OmpR family regulator
MTDSNLLATIKTCKVLYVEDDPFQLEQTTTLLSIFFDNISTATNAEEALELFQSERYDLVLCDIYLPKMSGISLAEEIKNIDENVKFIFSSSSCNMNDFKRLIQIQALDFLIKPYIFDDFRNAFIKFANEFSKVNNRLISINKNVVYNPLLHSVIVNSKEITLTQKEEQLLTLATRNINKVITYEEISKGLGYENINLNSIKNIILRLRKKLSTDIFANISGIGYRIV